MNSCSCSMLVLRPCAAHSCHVKMAQYTDVVIDDRIDQIMSQLSPSHDTSSLPLKCQQLVVSFIYRMERPELAAVKQLYRVSRGKNKKAPQRQPWQFWLPSECKHKAASSGDAQWSDLPVHAGCAILALGGHWWLHHLKRRRHGSSGSNDRNAQPQQRGNRHRAAAASCRFQGTARRNGHRPRFL